ncbi:pseudouridine synthase [Georgenia sp. Z1491]|uniref:pseudouridine synthase n=1 Tax=Georgenia sp. Z1491 TaxID=3416707 RepID=UPI003CF28CAF
MTDPHTPEGVRLQKVLAGAGVASRRASEELIAAGRVSVDGTIVRELGTRVDPATAVIHVDGSRVQLDDTLLTLALNKPRGVVSTMDDPDGRASLAQYVEGRTERLFHVGRLDADSEGLILLSNDGELAHRLTHPSYEVPKTYLATVEGRIAKAVSAQLREGLELEDGFVRPNEVTIKDTAPDATLVEVVLHEGRNHIVRRMFEQVGHPVTRLLRTRIGTIAIGDLRPGRTRVIAGPELGALMATVGM